MDLKPVSTRCSMPSKVLACCGGLNSCGTLSLAFFGEVRCGGEAMARVNLGQTCQVFRVQYSGECWGVGERFTTIFSIIVFSLAVFSSIDLFCALFA